MVEEMGLTLPPGQGMSVAQVQAPGLYIPDPRSPQEIDQPFRQPGLFVINGDGNIRTLDFSNAPFARPNLEMIRNCIKFLRRNGYPVRGPHQAT